MKFQTKVDMKKFLVVLGLVASFSANAAPSDEQIKQNIIQQSIASYPSVCACPYSTARNGSQCGGRSAYSKPGGYDPICYPADVTPQMLQTYKRQNNIVENLPKPEYYWTKPDYISPLQKAQSEIDKTKEYNRTFALQLESVNEQYTRIQKSMTQNNQYIKQQEDIIRELNLRAVLQSASMSYADKVRRRIKPNIVFDSSSIEGNPETSVLVELAPDGQILSNKIIRDSGYPNWDEAVIRALIRTGTLPKDESGKAPSQLSLVFRPKE